MQATEPARPGGIPAEAWWSPEDNEWILGAKDREGALMGLVRYWRPDGSLVNECEHLAGKRHGRSLRYHETGEISQRCWNEHDKRHGLSEWFMTDGPTTEKPRAEGLSEQIWRGELDYEHGTITAFRYYDREGHEVGMDGERLPARPVGVPSNALRSRKSCDWFSASFDKAGKPVGLLRRWTNEAVLFAEERHEGETVAVTAYRRDDGSRRAQYVLENKRLRGEALAWRRDGTLSVRAWFGTDQSWLEHLAADASVVRRAEYAPPPTSTVADAAQPSEDEQLVIDSLAGGDSSALELLEMLCFTPGELSRPGTLSPVGMGRVIARGWGGDGERDAGVARMMRRLVRKVAPPSLMATLARLQLDRSPRWQTPVRLAADVHELTAENTVDGDALRDELIAAGGLGATLALADPARAHGYLLGRLAEGRLNLMDLGLTELPAAIGRLHETSRLDAQGNRLVTLPDAVGDMFDLTLLDLGNNRITSLPRSLAWLPWLRSLYLGNNALTQLPSTVLELAELRTLSIGDNELEELPEAIGDLVGLEDLSLYDNRLRTLPRSLARLPLTFLHLGDHGWAEPPSVLSEISTLETLWIASPALERLPAEIVALPRLRKLMLWHSNVAEVPAELFEAKHLRELRISSNPLPPGTIEQLKEALPDCTIY